VEALRILVNHDRAHNPQATVAAAEAAAQEAAALASAAAVSGQPTAGAGVVPEPTEEELAIRAYGEHQAAKVSVAKGLTGTGIPGY
jgi:hypothetical protein